MKKAVRFSSQAGFSLIELMIVVAIIGILATVAIPNFNRFQAKAKQSEAKGNLSGIYSAEKAFYAEWSTYYGDFRDIGYSPDGRLTYGLGFAAVGTAPGNPFVANTVGGATAGACFSTDATTAISCSFHFQTMAQKPTFAPSGGASCGQANFTTTPSTTAFTASARGHISENTADDVWSVDEAKIVCNNTVGI